MSNLVDRLKKKYGIDDEELPTASTNMTNREKLIKEKESTVNENRNTSDTIRSERNTDNTVSFRSRVNQESSVLPRAREVSGSKSNREKAKEYSERYNKSSSRDNSDKYKSFNSLSEMGKYLLKNSNQVTSKATNVLSSLEAGEINSTNNIQKKSNLIGLNAMQGMFDNVIGVASAGLTPVMEGVKGIGKLTNNEKLYQYGNSGQNGLKALQDVNSYGSQVASKVDSNILRTASNVSRTLGNMAPSIALSALTGGVGSASKAGKYLLENSGGLLQATNVAGNETLRTLNDENSNYGKSALTGVLKGAVEYGTEKITGGNILAKGTSLDKKVAKEIADNVKSEVGKKLLSKGYDYAGEVAEEIISDTAGNFIDKIVNGKDLPTLKEWWENSKETAKETIITTAILNMLGVGGGTYQEVKELSLNNQQQAELNRAIQETNTELTNRIFNNTEQEPLLNEKNRYNVKVPEDTLTTTAQKYDINYKDTRLAEIQKVLDRKGIKSKFDDTQFTTPAEGARWSLATDENGNVTREIVLNPNADEETIVQELAIHELTHDIIAKNTDTSKKLYNEVVDYLRQDEEYNTYYSQLKEMYKDKYNDESTIEEEAVAKALQTKFGNQEEVTRLVNYKPTLARKIYDWVVDKLNNITGGRIEKLYWEDVRNKFERAYSEEYNGKNELNASDRYHISENFSKEIDQALNNELKSNTQIKARDYTPQILVDNGVSNLPMLITQKHIKSIIYNTQEAQNLGLPIQNVNYHGLGKELLVKAIDNLDTPQAIYKTNENNYLVVTEFKDNNGKEIVVPIQINGKGRYNDVFIDENQIKSAYGRNNLETYLKNNNFEQIYIKNKELDFNEGIQYSNVANSSIDNSIASTNENVNTTYSMQKSENNANSDNSSNIKYSIAGEIGMKNAIQNDYSNRVIEQSYNQALQLKDRGIDNESIRQSTNWFQDKNGDWKFEFSDKDMAIKQGVQLKNGRNYKLGDILEHDILFEVYPELENYNVEINSDIKASGIFRRQDNKILLNSNIVNNKQKTEGTLIHEIQHAIQNIEGFEGGMSSKLSRLTYYNSLGEIEATDTKSRFLNEKYKNKDMSNIAPESSKANPQHKKLNKYLKDRKLLDKVKDSVYNYFDKKGGNSYEVSNEKYQGNKRENNSEVSKNVLQENGKGLRKTWDRLGDNRRGRLETEKSSNKKSSLTNENIDTYLEKRIGKAGTRTTLKELKLNKAENTDSFSSKQKKKVLNPNEISQMGEEDANTTPKLSPKKYKKGNKKSNFYKNITEDSQFINEDLRNEMAKDENIKYYNGITNKETLEKAYTKLLKGGEKETLQWLAKENKNVSAEDVAEGWILLKQYQDNKDYSSAVEVAKKMRSMATNAGQTIQAYNILSRLTPEGMFYYAQKELSEAYDLMVKGKTKEWIDNNASNFDLTPEETEFIKNTMEEVSKMEDGYDKKVKLAEIQKVITDKIPPTAGKSIKAWMRISMLFNPKTQVRNVAGNAIILPVNAVSDRIASGIDRMVAKKTGVRTTGTMKISEYANGFKKGLYESYNDFKKGINTRNIDGNKFEIRDGKNFKDKGIGKALNRIDNILSFALDAGDRGFYEATFTNSINNQLVLNGTTEVTTDMIEIATNEALQRTWQDNNAYTQIVLLIRNALNGKVGNRQGMQYGLGDILIPFAKTPANLTKAIVDYSPVGLTKSLLVDARKLKNSIENGQYTPQLQHKTVQNIGKGFAGTFLYVIGTALAKAGVTSGEADDDKDVKNFMKNSLGVSSYSIKIGDKTFTYDWAQPVAAPLSITANIVNSNQKGKATLKAILSNLDTAGSVLLEQSFLQSLNDVFNNSDGSMTGLINEVLELPARAIPTFCKQIADMVDGTQRSTYEYNDPIKSTINTMKSKIPYASKTLPVARDTLGNEIKKYGGENNWWNVFFNPANTNKGKLSKAGEEIYNIYMQTGDTTIFPRTAPYYINDKGEKRILTASQKNEFQEKSGQYVEKVLNDLITDSDYKKLTNEEKAGIINEIVTDSYAKAKYDVLKIDTTDYSKLRNVLNKVNATSYYNYKIQTNGVKKDQEKIKILVDSKYSDKEKTALYENYIKSKDDIKYDIIKSTGLNINSYLGYKLASSNGEFDSDKEDDGTEKGKTVKNSAKKKIYDYINNIKGTTYTQRLILTALEYKPEKESDRILVVNYINSLKNLTESKRKEMLNQFKGITIYKDGRIDY